MKAIPIYPGRLYRVTDNRVTLDVFARNGAEAIARYIKNRYQLEN